MPRITQIVLGEPSASIRHHRSSQLPLEGEAQRWTVGDRGNQPAQGYFVYLCKWNGKGGSHPDFPEVIASITGEGPLGGAGGGGPTPEETVIVSVLVRLSTAVSVTINVSLPAVLSVAENVCTPLSVARTE